MPLIGKKTAGATFHLYDETLSPDIRDALRRTEVGQTVEVSLTGSGEKPRTLRLSLRVTAVQKLDLPAVDEAFVRKVTGGKITSADALKQSMKEDLSRYWNERGEAAVANALADEVVRLHEFPVPSTLVDVFLDSFIEDVRSRNKGSRLPAGFDQQKFREENRAGAVWQARWMLLKERIAEAEGLSVTDEELAQRAEAEAARSGIERERVLQYYRGSASARERMLSDKIIHFLRSHAAVTERPVDALHHQHT
jgi:trigger factor